MIAVDLSNRRGALVPIREKIYRILCREHEMPNFIYWKQENGRHVVDVNRKWLIAFNSEQDNKEPRGVLFYRLAGKEVYIEDFAVSGPSAAGVLITKFEYESEVKLATDFYFSERIRRETNDQILETVGLQDDSVFNEDGYQSIGDLGETVKALKVRYLS